MPKRYPAEVRRDVGAVAQDNAACTRRSGWLTGRVLFGGARVTASRGWVAHMPQVHPTDRSRRNVRALTDHDAPVAPPRPNQTARVATTRCVGEIYCPLRRYLAPGLTPNG